MRIDRLPRRKFFGQASPLGASLDPIEDGVEDFTQGGARAAAFFGGGQEAAQQVPMVVGKVGVVSSDFHRPHCATAKESLKIAIQIKRFS